jgi:cytochrome c oxidase subunit 2
MVAKLILVSSFFVGISIIFAKTNTEKYKNKLISSPDFDLLSKYGCIACHSVDGSKMIGPSFLDLAKGKVKVKNNNGKEKDVVINAEYIRRAIVEPNEEIVVGYRKFSMPEQKHRLKGKDLEKIVKLLTP